MCKKIVFVFIFLFIFNFSTTKVFSYEVFYDNFNFLDITKWIYYQNDGVIFFNNDGINLETNLMSGIMKFPYFYSKNNIVPQSGDFEINFQIKKTLLRPYGTGIAIAEEVPPNGNFSKQMGRYHQIHKRTIY